MANLLAGLPILMGVPDAGGQAGAGSIMPTLVTFGLIFLIFYFLIIRPQNKKQKETKAMLDALQRGDRVVTIGGVRGIIQSLKDDTVVLKVDGETKIEFSRSAISSIIEKRAGKSKAKAPKRSAPEPEDDDIDDDANSDTTED
ncbi:MAG: preprotein translocase subunit YajC [Spirochaetaceae bacterium]|nr:MAG: preprotein translocase subunit YajC [Spirochaetaceae bacterium]